MEIRKGRIGKFFFFVGFILLLIFFSIDQSQEIHVGYFLAGILFAFLGVYLMWRDARRSPPPERFRMFRKMKKKEREKEKEDL